MAVRIGPPASSGREPRQARKGAAAAANASAGVRLVRAASILHSRRLTNASARPRASFLQLIPGTSSYSRRNPSTDDGIRIACLPLAMTFPGPQAPPEADFAANTSDFAMRIG